MNSITYRSAPKLAEPANNRIIATVIKLGFVLTVPSNKKLIFINAPAIKAGDVRQPRINPRLTKNSPHGTNTLNNSTFGRAKF